MKGEVYKHGQPRGGGRLPLSSRKGMRVWDAVTGFYAFEADCVPSSQGEYRDYRRLPLAFDETWPDRTGVIIRLPSEAP